MARAFKIKENGEDMLFIKKEKKALLILILKCTLLHPVVLVQRSWDCEFAAFWCCVAASRALKS